MYKILDKNSVVNYLFGISEVMNFFGEDWKRIDISIIIK